MDTIIEFFQNNKMLAMLVVVALLAVGVLLIGGKKKDIDGDGKKESPLWAWFKNVLKTKSPEEKERASKKRLPREKAVSVFFQLHDHLAANPATKHLCEEMKSEILPNLFGWVEPVGEPSNQSVETDPDSDEPEQPERIV